MRKQKWLRRFLVFAVAVLAGSFGLSRALRTNAARRYLIAHLVASFGRPVDVGQFDFSLLDGGRIEARAVTVTEDPHFGNEYFLRAEALTAGLRWPSLFSGHFEFGSVSLLRPSLNLVRDSDGHWNIERWLPPAQPGTARPGFVGPIAARGGVRAARVYRIDVHAGRINFKQNDDKSPFALLDVSGSVEQDSAGRWQLDIEAQPMRAGVELQDIGTLRLRGTIAGTSARLQPAELNLTWREASLADALRLARQQDYGMRGGLEVVLTARVAPPESASIQIEKPSGARWSISGVARLTGVHGWRLPEHDTDPAANLSIDATWRLGEPHAQIQKLVVEMSKSRLQAAGDLDWSRGFRPQIHIDSPGLSLEDVLSWYGAFRPGVPEDLHAEGMLGIDVTLGGWPLQLQQGAIASAGASLATASLHTPLRIGRVNVSITHGGLNFAPTEISFTPIPPEAAASKNSAGSASANSLVVSGSLIPGATGSFRWPLNWNFAIQGTTSRVQDWLALAAVIAQPVNYGWTAEGGITIQMRGTRRPQSPAAAWLGTMDFRDLLLNPAYFNQPIRLAGTHVEFAPLQRKITLVATKALGASWNGSLTQKNSDTKWTFDLSADRLDAADLDRWLGPRARPGFLARIADFGSNDSVTPQTGTVLDRLTARGRLRVGEIAMTSLLLDQFDGHVEVAGRTIQVHKAQADFFGGNIKGEFTAQLLPDPTYDFQGRFDSVNLQELAGAVPSLSNRVAGLVSATLSLTAHGIGRQNLIASMEGTGELTAHNAEIRGLDVTKIFPGKTQDPTSSLFASVKGNFQISKNEIHLSNFDLDQPRGRLQADGKIDFSHALNLRIRPSVFQAATSLTAASPAVFLLDGTIENPNMVFPSSPTASVTRRR